MDAAEQQAGVQGQNELIEAIGRQVEAIEREIQALPIEDAQCQAERLLADPDHFACEQVSPTEVERLKIQPLAPYLRSFFERYRSVHPIDPERGYVNDNHVSRWIEPEHLWWGEPGLLPIGVEHGGCFCLWVKPGEETIYFKGAFPEDPERTYPSIHHYFLATDRQRRIPT
jgi:hypothetical protein